MTFDEFWEAYPKRTPHANPKAPAKSKFEALVRSGVDGDEIIEGARLYASVMADQDSRFVCQATTFLNQERWRDYLPTEQERLAGKHARQQALKGMAKIWNNGGRPEWIREADVEEMKRLKLIGD